ncbi:class II fructose-bisphosphate aldolase [Candidatus Enterococcus ferrettii]|uniref:Fructose-bisphosphate aldolase, class II n=1 Tax=Candidatus Enterococcus ferrettii TaxID=2815324 RepID=A0ABV0ETR3_9ENTE|nr:class II fructose-bisphosphate aldolase [Enterococcus sp. 665A]MBO1340884.1 class II fructose-bisphosphate aldolase [Enterococcus sp. 665A]
MLVTLKELLADAKKNKYAVGAFNVPNLEAIRGVIEAAEELNSPVILQHAEVHEGLVSIEEIGPLMLDYAHKAKVPVAVHLDHGATFEMCVKAIQMGFTSVMYDASSKEYEVNRDETKEIVKIAHAVGVSVEAELGHIFTSAVGGGEGRGSDSSEDYEDLDDVYTDPDLAKHFVEETDVDCLAIGFGTVHGVYLKEPKLDLDRITLIKDKVDVPFVMHGGSGVSKENYKIAINNGICKINYYTYMNKAAGNAVKDFLESRDAEAPIFFDEISLAATAAMKKNAKDAMAIFMNP